MSTDIRPEVSKKKEYWIPKHRYYELKHFVMQYPEWKQYLNDTLGVSSSPSTDSVKVQLGAVSDPTWLIVKKREVYNRFMRLVEHVTHLTDEEYGDLIFRHVVNGAGYNDVKDSISLSRSEYYNLYRKFFYILDQSRYLYEEV